MSITKVLLVSNDFNTKNVIDKNLTFNGFVVNTATESTFAWKFLEEIRFDFIMIDMQLKGESGLAFYKSLRQVGNNIPVMMIGEGKLDKFLLEDLSNENYSYILKPMKFNDLKMKINSFLDLNVLDEKVMSFGNLKIDRQQQLLIFKNKLLQLSKMELDIILLLAQKSGNAIHPKKITKLLEREGKFYTLSTYYYVSKLREKLQKYGGDALDICFVQDQGYKLSLPN